MYVSYTYISKCIRIRNHRYICKKHANPVQQKLRVYLPNLPDVMKPKKPCAVSPRSDKVHPTSTGPRPFLT